MLKISLTKGPGRRAFTGIAPLAAALVLLAYVPAAAQNEAPPETGIFQPASVKPEPPSPQQVAARPEPVEEGVASWYGPNFHGRTTANGETFDQEELTAAHPELPFDTEVEVTDVATGESVVVRITDRGPFTGGRIIDLSRRAAAELGIKQDGIAEVQVQATALPD